MASAPVIRPALLDRDCPVELLQQQQPGQFVGEGERREAEAPAGPGLEGRIQPIGAADHEGQPLGARALQALGEGHRAPQLPLLAQHHQLLIAAQLGRDRLGLALGAGILELDDAQSRQPFEIDGQALLNPTLAHLAHREHPDPAGIEQKGMGRGVQVRPAVGRDRTCPEAPLGDRWTGVPQAQAGFRQRVQTFEAARNRLPGWFRSPPLPESVVPRQDEASPPGFAERFDGGSPLA